jgi:probable F420-dependent oxidoreductase
MKVGLYMNTHGVGATVDRQWTLQPIPAATMDVPRVARRAELAGFDSLWFSDHVLMTPSPASEHRAADPVTGARAYPGEPDMLDAVAGLAAAAAVTDRIRLAPSVWIAPYRHPLHDVRQFTSLDVLSNGRLVVALGAGWMREEFAALGVDFDQRVARVRESVAVYRRAWSEEVSSFAGSHFGFQGVRMDPKPVQSPGPPIYYGGITTAGARIAAECCDGFYPTFTDPMARADRYDETLATVADSLADANRRIADFALLAVVSARVDAAMAGDEFGKGSPAKVLEDLAALAQRGFSLAVLHLDTRDGTLDEWHRQLDAVGELLVGPAGQISAEGPWRQA